MKEIILVIICIVLYGVSTFFKRLGLNNLHPYQLLLIAGICYGILIPVWLWLIRTDVQTAPSYSTQSIIFVIIYAIINVAAGLVFSFLLKNSNSPGTLVAIINLSSLITFVLSYLFLNEQISTTKIIAFCLAILSMILFNC